MIVTFYSYKGGVGRTQLLVNIASYLCYYKDKKVLLIEWDLEAPGLHFYFGKNNADIKSKGLIDLLYKYMELMRQKSTISKDELPYFNENHIIKNLITSKNKQGRIDLIPAANYAEKYSQKINDFNWQEFMELRDGKVYIDFIREKLLELNYDYIFIDSRTGIADYSGLCNILIPDVNIVVIAPTIQNFKGALKIIKAIKEHPYVTEGYRKSFTLPILSRIDNETEDYEEWLGRFVNEFQFAITELIPENLLNKKLNEFVFEELFLPETILFYNRKLALGENILFTEEKKHTSELSIANNYTKIADFIEEIKSNDEINFSDLIVWEKLKELKINPIPKHLGKVPTRPTIFIGRENDLEMVYEKLWKTKEKNQTLLIVNAEGGIGKTTLAASYYNKYEDQYHHLAWVFAKKSITEALLRINDKLNIPFDVQLSNEERLELLIHKLRELEKPCLLVLDNANTLADLDKHYKMLRSLPNFHVLLTTRIKEFEQAAFYKIKPLEEEDAIKLFKKHYKNHQESENDILKGIMEAVGYNTLVIELLAKNLNHFNNRLKRRYSLQSLLEDIQKKGLLALSQSKEVYAEYQTLAKGKAEEIIEAMYDLGQLETEELAMLAVFAVLPAENIAFDVLEELFTPVMQLEKENEVEFKELLAKANLEQTQYEKVKKQLEKQVIINLDLPLLSLAQKGWLDFNEEQGSFRISPVIQEVTKKKHQDLLGDCRSLISALIDKLSYEMRTGHFINVSYGTAALLARYGESIVSNIYVLDNNIAILCERLGNYHQTTGNLQQALSYFEQYNLLEKELHDSYPSNVEFKNNLAISYEKLGQTHTALGNLQQALTYFEQYNLLEKELHKDYPSNVEFKNNLAISYSKLGSTHSALGNLPEALKFFEQRNQIGEELYGAYPDNVSFKNGLAISYSKLGQTHSALGNLPEALKFFEQYNQLEKELHNAYPDNVSFKNSLAISYSKLGSTHSALGNLPAALKFFEQDIRLTEELYRTYPDNVSFKNGLALAYQWLGHFLETKMNNKQKAKEHYLSSKKLLEELVNSFPAYVEFQKNLAWVNNRLGELP